MVNIEKTVDPASYLEAILLIAHFSQNAAAKTKDGQLDHNKALTGAESIEFVDQRLVTCMKGFKQRATGPYTIEDKMKSSARSTESFLS